jgi:hypothetical protein
LPGMIGFSWEGAAGRFRARSRRARAALMGSWREPRWLPDALSQAMLRVGNSRGDGRARQYSSASMIVSTRVVTEGSAGSGECATMARSK